MYRSLMIQGTGSGVGKSIIVMALCRILSNRGLNAAPFKAQNMALNSFITKEGGEIGRAQALQAEAARVEPSIHMNPVLLKASGDMGSQVILQGKVHSTMKAREYYQFRKESWDIAAASFDILSSRHDLIILEGAGSPAEINLMDVDIVNMRSAQYANAPVLLVGDIDRGGVFASLYGTVKLVGRHSRRIRGFIINKFRGDMEILNPGLQMIYKKTGKPVIGVLPYVYHMGLPEEDGLSLKDIKRGSRDMAADLKVVIVPLRYISNFTDFDPLAYEPDIEMVYSNNPDDIGNADIIIIPGTKNTVRDLLMLRETGVEDTIKRAHSRGAQVIGICGGYQMLGRVIKDPYHVESEQSEVNSMDMLDTETVFERQKTTCQALAEVLDPKDLTQIAEGFDMSPLTCYEIHMGETSGDVGIFSIKRYGSNAAPVPDGSCSANCWGTYLHGIFDNDSFRRAVLDRRRIHKGLKPADYGVRYSKIKDSAIDRAAELISSNLDMKQVERLLRL